MAIIDSRRTDLAWAAGLFEGEGSITVGMISNNRSYPTLALAMTDKDVVERFKSIVGTVNPIYEIPLKSGKTYYRWRCRKRDDIIRILSLLYPYFGDRRRQKADETFKWFNDYQPWSRK